MPAEVVQSYGALVLDKVRALLIQRGSKGIAGLSRKFRSLDVWLYVLFIIHNEIYSGRMTDRSR